MPSASLSAPGERLRNLWRRLAPLPGGKALFTFLLGRMTPYSGSIGARVDELEPGWCRVALRDRRRVRNHLGSIHAMALANLAEMASGLAVLVGLPADVQGIVTGFSITYLKKARGLLTAECRAERLNVTAEQEYEAAVAVTDAQGNVVARASARWRLRPVPLQAGSPSGSLGAHALLRCRRHRPVAADAATIDALRARLSDLLVSEFRDNTRVVIARKKLLDAMRLLKFDRGFDLLVAPVRRIEGVAIGVGSVVLEPLQVVLGTYREVGHHFALVAPQQAQLAVGQVGIIATAVVRGVVPGGLQVVDAALERAPQACPQAVEAGEGGHAAFGIEGRGLAEEAAVAIERPLPSTGQAMQTQRQLGIVERA